MSQETNRATGAEGQAWPDDWFCFPAARLSEKRALFPGDSQTRVELVWLLALLPCCAWLQSLWLWASLRVSEPPPRVPSSLFCVGVLLEDCWLKTDMTSGRRKARILLWALLLHLVHRRWEAEPLDLSTDAAVCSPELGPHKISTNLPDLAQRVTSHIYKIANHPDRGHQGTLKPWGDDKLSKLGMAYWATKLMVVLDGSQKHCPIVTSRVISI